MMEITTQSDLKIESSLSPRPGIKEQAGKLVERVRNWLPFWKQEVKGQPEVVVEQISRVDSILPETPKEEIMESKNELEELSIDGLPEGTRITTAITPDRQHEMNELRWVVKSDIWNLRAVSHGEELWMSMKPKMMEGVENIGEGRYLDTKLASINETGDLVTQPDSGYEVYHEGVIKQEDGILFRGLSKEEMDDIVSTGVIKSRGDVVNDIGAHKGLTFFSKNPEQSLGYAIAQRIPGYRSPSFDNPNYLVMVNDPGNHIVEGDTEIGIETAIPAEQIIKVFEVRPVLIEEGEI